MRAADHTQQATSDYYSATQSKTASLIIAIYIHQEHGISMRFRVYLIPSHLRDVEHSTMKKPWHVTHSYKSRKYLLVDWGRAHADL